MEKPDQPTNNSTCSAPQPCYQGIIAITLAGGFLAVILGLVLCISLIYQGNKHSEAMRTVSTSKALALVDGVVPLSRRAAAGIASAAGTASAAQSENQQSCDTATPDQARRLLSSLFPNMSIIATTPVATGNGTACILEVELLADRSHPNTEGVVYVLPGGESFLNGPLMNSDSSVSLSVEDAPTAMALPNNDADDLLSQLPSSLESEEGQEWLKNYILLSMLESRK